MASSTQTFPMADVKSTTTTLRSSSNHSEFLRILKSIDPHLIIPLGIRMGFSTECLEALSSYPKEVLHGLFLVWVSKQQKDVDIRDLLMHNCRCVGLHTQADMFFKEASLGGDDPNFATTSIPGRGVLKQPAVQCNLEETIRSVISGSDDGFADFIRSQLVPVTDLANKIHIKSNIIKCIFNQMELYNSSDEFAERSVSHQLREIHNAFKVIQLGLTSTSCSPDDAFVNYVAAVHSQLRDAGSRNKLKLNVMTVFGDATETPNMSKRNTYTDHKIDTDLQAFHKNKLHSTEALAAYTFSLVEMYQFHVLLSLEYNKIATQDIKHSVVNRLHESHENRRVCPYNNSSAAPMSDKEFLHVWTRKCHSNRRVVAEMYDLMDRSLQKSPRKRVSLISLENDTPNAKRRGKEKRTSNDNTTVNPSARRTGGMANSSWDHTSNRTKSNDLPKYEANRLDGKVPGGQSSSTRMSIDYETRHSDNSQKGIFKRFTGHLRQRDHNVNRNKAVNKKAESIVTACRKDDMTTVKTLVSNGTAVNVKDSKGCTPLHAASAGGSLSLVEYLLSHGADVNDKINDGSTPLHCATIAGHIEVVKRLLKGGSDIECEDYNGRTALSLAYEQRSNDLLSLLMDESARSESHETMETMNLHTACLKGNLKIVESHLAKGANINEKNKDGYSPLHVGAEKGHLNVVKCLLEHGAKVNEQNVDGNTPLSISSQTDVISYLIDNGADLEKHNNKGWTLIHNVCKRVHLEALKCVVENEAHVNKQAVDGFTPLHIAASNGHFESVDILLSYRSKPTIKTGLGNSFTPLSGVDSSEVVSYLLRQGADVNICDVDGLTPLHIACFAGNLRVIECLVKRGADINKQDVLGMTPLIIASFFGHVDILKYYTNPTNDIVACFQFGMGALLQGPWENEKVETISYLIQQGAHTNTTDNTKCAPLHITCQLGMAKVTRCLVENGAEVNKKEHNGRTPLHAACLGGNPDTVKYLIDHNANIDDTSSYGETPILLASENGNNEVVSYLIGQGADIRKSDDQGWTPVHTACWKGHLSIVKILIDKGAEIEQKIQIGYTPLHVAAQNGHIEVVQYLLTKGSQINNMDNTGRTTLSLAAEHDRMEMISFLIAQGADLEMSNNQGWTPLHIACWKGHFNIVRCLVEKGANLDKQHELGYTPIHVGLANGFLEIMESRLEDKASTTNNFRSVYSSGSVDSKDVISYLISKGADISKGDNKGWTILHIACVRLCFRVVECLVANGADLNTPQEHGMTPLHLTISATDYVNILKSLTGSLGLQEGFDVQFFPGPSHAPLKIVSHLVDHGAEIEKRDNKGQTPLHIACIIGNTDVVAYLLKKGADPNEVDENGYTALHIAARYDHLLAMENALKGQYKDVGLISLLISSKGADLNKGDHMGWTLLHIACLRGYLEVVKKLVEHGVDVNRHMVNGNTALHVSAQQGHVEVVAFLLKRNCQIDIQSCSGLTPLYLAAESGKVDVVSCLISHHANVAMSCPNGWTPLHIACLKGHLGVVERILQSGADVNQKTTKGYTPLHVSVSNGHIEIIKGLLKHKCKVDVESETGRTPLSLASEAGKIDAVSCLINHADTEISDFEGKTPLHFASMEGHLSVVKVLVSKGGNIHARSSSGFTPISLASKCKKREVISYFTTLGKKDVKCVRNPQPLYDACANGQLSVVQRLVQSGADVNQKMKNGYTSLHVSALHGHESIVKYLLNQGCTIDAKSATGRTPLSLAAGCSNINIISRLLSRGADVEKSDIAGWTPLHVACSKGNLTVVECLVRHGADVNKRKENGSTALHISAFNGYITIVEYLLDHGCKISELSPTGQSVLSRASAGGHSNVVSNLIKHGADVKQSDNIGWTSLHHACLKGHLKVAKYLVENGAEVNKKEGEGYTPLHLCARYGHLDVVKYLLDINCDINVLSIGGKTPFDLAVQRCNESVISCLKDHVARTRKLVSSV